MVVLVVAGQTNSVTTLELDLFLPTFQLEKGRSTGSWSVIRTRFVWVT